MRQMSRTRWRKSSSISMLEVEVVVRPRSARRRRRRARSAAATPPGSSRLLAGVAVGSAGPSRPRSRRAGAARLRDLEEPDRCGTGRRTSSSIGVDEHRAACRPSCAGWCTRSPASLGGRQLVQVGQQRLLVGGMDDDVADHAAMLARPARSSPPVTRPMVHPGIAGTARIRAW